MLRAPLKNKMTVIRQTLRVDTLFSRKGVVGAAGLEPALIAETDFESVASTIPPRPRTGPGALSAAVRVDR